MPNSIQNVGFGSPGMDYSADLSEIERRRALAKALQEQSMSPIQAPQQPGSRIHPFQGIAKMMQASNAAGYQDQVIQQQRALAQKAQADALRWHGEKPGVIQPDPQENQIAQDQGTPAVAPTQPTPQSLQAWALRGASNPLTAPIASQVLAHQFKAEDPYTLPEGAVRVGPDNKPLATNPKVKLPMIEHNFSVGNNMVQPHISMDNGLTWSPVPGSQPSMKFARQDAPITPTMTEVVDPKDPTRLLRVDAKLYKGGTLGEAGVLGVSGKEPTAAKREDKAAEGRDLLKTEIDNLREHYRVLNEARAIPSSDRGVMSNATAWMQSSTPGQVMGRIAGTKEQDARNQIQSSRLRVLNAIKNATGMSAQQLNSNAELKTWLDSLTSLGGSYESNMGILDSIENAFIKQTGKQGSPRVVDW